MIIFLVSAMVIFVLGAVNHPGMDWNKEEFEENKKLARITVFVELLVVIALTYLGMAEKYILFMSFGMILCAILLTLGKITGQEVKCCLLYTSNNYTFLHLFILSIPIVIR